MELTSGRLEQESCRAGQKEAGSTGQKGMVRWYEVPLRSLVTQGLTLDLTA